MTRDEMIDKAADALSAWEAFTAYDGHASLRMRNREDMTDLKVAERVLDAILPQVTTVEELEALPATSILVGDDDSVFATTAQAGYSLLCLLSHRTPDHNSYCLKSGYVLNMYGPLTVVWTP